MKSGSAEIGNAAAARGLERLDELSPDVLAAAVLTVDGELLAGDPEGDWAPAVAELWSAADGAGAGATQIHVGTEDGEVFAFRDDVVAVVAVTRRFALASLMQTDLRALARDLRAGNLDGSDEDFRSDDGGEEE